MQVGLTRKQRIDARKRFIRGFAKYVNKSMDSVFGITKPRRASAYRRRHYRKRSIARGKKYFRRIRKRGTYPERY